MSRGPLEFERSARFFCLSSRFLRNQRNGRPLRFQRNLRGPRNQRFRKKIFPGPPGPPKIACDFRGTRVNCMQFSGDRSEWVDKNNFPGPPKTPWVIIDGFARKSFGERKQIFEICFIEFQKLKKLFL